ncbi:hypothetical protein AXF42_Ash005288 [Apostasia shenzhenica]|uniref:Uncharacterized protein n=1 Tax=Apostasia shenzhenica TaxID=1088818 RepID=A0A2I0B6G9_9ASPA|nr:hypothetical protein AXF42_Ash005288 [Apostasia shenzhenica]
MHNYYVERAQLDFSLNNVNKYAYLDYLLVLSFIAWLAVSEQLMITHEDLLQGNFQSIENLRKSNFGMNVVSQSRQIIKGFIYVTPKNLFSAVTFKV